MFNYEGNCCHHCLVNEGTSLIGSKKFFYIRSQHFKLSANIIYRLKVTCPSVLCIKAYFKCAGRDDRAGPSGEARAGQRQAALGLWPKTKRWWWWWRGVPGRGGCRRCCGEERVSSASCAQSPHRVQAQHSLTRPRHERLWSVYTFTLHLTRLLLTNLPYTLISI